MGLVLNILVINFRKLFPIPLSLSLLGSLLPLCLISVNIPYSLFRHLLTLSSIFVSLSPPPCFSLSLSLPLCHSLLISVSLCLYLSICLSLYVPYVFTVSHFVSLSFPLKPSSFSLFLHICF